MIKIQLGSYKTEVITRQLTQSEYEELFDIIDINPPHKWWPHKERYDSPYTSILVYRKHRQQFAQFLADIGYDHFLKVGIGLNVD